MADLKISQLPSVTVLDPTDLLPVVDAGLTKRVTIRNLSDSLPITTFVQGASAFWGSGGGSGGTAAAQYLFSPPYTPGPGNDNLTNNTDNFPRWNTQVYNTSPSTFELINSNTTSARIFLKSAGYYLLIANIHYFDLYNNMQFTASLFNSAASTGAMAFITRLSSKWYVGAAVPPGQSQDSSTIFYAASPGYYTVSLNPTLNTPYPASNGNTPSRITFFRLLPS